MPKRSATPSSVASQLYEAGSVGDETANGLGLIGRPRSVAASSKRASTASRWASRPSASASVRIVGRSRARPSRVIRWTCENLP